MTEEEYQELLLSEYDEEQIDELAELLINDNWRDGIKNNEFDVSANETVKVFERKHQLKKIFYGSDLIR